MFNYIIILSLIYVNPIQSGSIPDVCLDYCLNGGICYKSKENPKCFCLPQWTGERCHLLQNSTAIEQMPVVQGDTTDSRNAQCNRLNPPFCQNGGICYVDTNTDKFACHCPDPYIGEHCEEKSECDGYCINGDCEIVSDKPDCKCYAGWTGIRCGIRLTTTTTTQAPTTTTSLLCNRLGSYCNSGTCFEVNGAPRCLCPPTFTGVQCTVPLDGTITDRTITSTLRPNVTPPVSPTVTCAQSPCKNRGACYDNGNSFFCLCPYPYTGTTCESTRQ